MSMQIETSVVHLLCECGSASDHASDLEVIRHDVWELKNTVQNLIDLVAPIQAEIQPMLEGLANSPLGKMMGISNG